MIRTASRALVIAAYQLRRNSTVQLLPEVQRAIAEGRPVVALESTIISHGMPYPRNLEMAREVEEVIRKFGAVPATIAIIDGVPKAGLNEADLLKLASNKDNSVLKASTRDMAHACATGATAATTVASTMKLAHLAGISVFATGGIGGVHRGVEETMDISADLLELSRTPVTVVCAGIKSILDIPKSLEVLETNSVPVLSYKTSVFPAFYTNDSGIASPRAVKSSEDAAKVMGFQRALQLGSGVLVAVPNPSPASGDKITYAINFALQSAKNEGIAGAKVTPYVLDKVQKLTEGASLESNIALVMNNAEVAAKIAVHYAELLKTNKKVQKEHQLAFGQVGRNESVEASVVPVTAAADVPVTKSSSEKISETRQVTTPVVATTPASAKIPTNTVRQSSGPSEIVVVGGAVVDLIGHISTHTKLGTSNPGKLSISHGGVGRNIADSLARLGRNVSLATAVADDLNGRSLLESSREKGIDVSLTRVLPSSVAKEVFSEEKGVTSPSTVHATAVYNAIHDNAGDLCIGIADMEIFSQINTTHIHSLAQSIAQSKLVAADGNLSKEAFAALANVCHQLQVPLFFEPTSDHKCLLPFQAGVIDKVDILKPNTSELVQMVNHCLTAGLINSGRALVANTLSNIAANRSDASHLHQLDVADVRMLLNVLYQVMNSPSSGHSDHQNQAKAKTGFLNSILKQDTPVVKSTKEPVAAESSPTNTTRAIRGKHIIVSLGSRGVMWCGPSALLALPNTSADSAYLKDGAMVVNEATQSATILVPAMAVQASDIVHTNGAGDAFCAGLLAEIARKHAAGHAAGLPDIECIRQGLLNAHTWLVSK